MSPMRLHLPDAFAFESLVIDDYMGIVKQVTKSGPGHMGTDNFITLFFLAVAALIFFNLRNVLGRRTGNEKPPANPGDSRDRTGVGPSAPSLGEGKVITLPRRDMGEPENRYSLIDDFARPDTPLNETLRSVKDADPAFDPKEFVKGARMAYEMIVSAFAEGDRKTLKSLLSPDVFEGFNAAISEREAKGETVKSTFVGIDKAEMKSASLSPTEVTITMRMVSQLISATYGRDKKLVDGDEQMVSEVIDIWTFARDISSRDPNWKLVSTQSES